MMDRDKPRRPIEEALAEIEVISEEQATYYRSLTVAQKLEIVFDLNRQVRRQVADRFRRENPDWTGQQIQAAVARKFLNESDEEILEFVA